MNSISGNFQKFIKKKKKIKNLSFFFVELCPKTICIKFQKILNMIEKQQIQPKVDGRWMAQYWISSPDCRPHQQRS